MSIALLDRHEEGIGGVLSCYDRIIVTGTLPTVCYADGMTRFLNARHIRIFDYPRFAEPLRERVREQAAALTRAAGISIEHVGKKHIRKEAVVAKVLERRGDAPGLVHVISAMEGCDTYKPWHDKQTGKTYLRPDNGQCPHYYFYFMDEELGLIHLRVPTWAPFRLQFHGNGHSWLARRLTSERIAFTAADNAFIHVADWHRARELADDLSPDLLHRVLDRYAAPCCPVLDVFGQTYHWSLTQVEYATDVVFRSSTTLAPLYEHLIRASVLNVKVEQIASFLGRKIAPQLRQEVGSQFATRIEGTCVKHRFGSASIKMYDKFGRVLRIETTANDVSFFKHHRKVEHKSGPPSRKVAPIKKTIYSLIDLRAILFGCNRRYLEHLSALDDVPAGLRVLKRLIGPRKVGDRTIKGINFFAAGDSALLHALQNPKATIAGLRRGDLLGELGMFSPGQLSRQLRRLLDLGVIKRVRGTYRYYLTKAGRAATAVAERLTGTLIVPVSI